MSIVEKTLLVCQTWAQRVREETSAEGIYVFGSLIHRRGTDFLPKSSDVDLIIVMPDQLRCAPSRTAWLVQLQELKRQLEISLISQLPRDPDVPIGSLVPITRFELQRDINKSGSRTFLRKNKFLDLLDAQRPAPLRRTEALPVDDDTREIYGFAQKVRNKFLSVSASGKLTFLPGAGSVDRIPKDIMRYAAIASYGGHDLQKRTDLQCGFNSLSGYLYSQEEFHPSYAQLHHDWFSVRRGARQEVGPLPPESYLLLSEAILDLSFATVRREITPSRNKASNKQGTTHINGYKLFYFRAQRGLSIPALSRATGIEVKRLRQLEKIQKRKGNLDPTMWFAACNRSVLDRLENALGANGRLEVGKADDFLTQYMLFYDKQKSSNLSKHDEAKPRDVRFKTKAIVFDFDGTLTQPGDYRSTWEKIWVALGYPKEMCFDLHHRYQKGEFNHGEWCRLTLEAFKAAKLRREHVVEIAKAIPLIEGVHETVNALRAQGLKLFILSGSIKIMIREVLSDLYHEFEEIKANELIFDRAGNISKIEGTRYDFEGKAEFIKRIIQDYDLSPSEVLFVGNDCNDVFASRSGARTLCVNARLTDPANEEHWTYAIGDMRNLHQILEFIVI